MGAEIVEVVGDLLTCKVTGRLTQNELLALQSGAAEIIRLHNKVRIMIIAEDFQGWERGADWDDVTFQSENDPKIERMAIVGEKKWEDLANAFVGRGLRDFPIEYFASNDMINAMRWLAKGTRD